MQNVTIIDRGPKAPEAPGKDASDDQRSRFVRDKEEAERWHKEHSEPARSVVSSVDANEAVRRDPDRYEIEIRHPNNVNLSLEDRVTVLERRMAALDAAEIEPEPEPEPEPVLLPEPVRPEPQPQQSKPAEVVRK